MVVLDSMGVMASLTLDKAPSVMFSPSSKMSSRNRYKAVNIVIPTIKISTAARPLDKMCSDSMFVHMRSTKHIAASMVF